MKNWEQDGCLSMSVILNILFKVLVSGIISELKNEQEEYVNDGDNNLILESGLSRCDQIHDCV